MTFVPRWILGDLDLTEWPFLSLPDDYGSPENVMEVVDSLLADGSIVSSDRTANRTITHTVWIEEADSAALATAEAALIAETDKQRNTFTIEPGDGFGYATVFDTFRVQAQHVLNMDEERAGLRRYDLTIPALPYGRSVDEVEVTAAPSTATPTTVDGCTATTNWSNFYGPGGTNDADIAVAAVTFDSRSAVRFTNGKAFSLGSFPVKYAGAAPGSTYVGLVVYNFLDSVALTNADGSVYTLPLAVESDGAWRTFWFLTPTPNTPLYFYLGNGSGGWSPGAQVWIDKLVTSPGIGFASLLAVPVYGSVRTTGRYSITRADGTGGLGWVTMFSDPAMENGAYHPAVQATWENAPEGTYAFWKDPLGGLLEVTVTDASGQSQTMTTNGQWDNPVTGDTHPDLVPVGELTLGGTYDGLVGALTFEVKVDGIIVTGPTTPRLFRKHPDTSLTHVLIDGDLADLADEVIVESPSVERPFGGVWADGQNVIARCVSWEDPTFTPATTYLFVEANGSDTDPVQTVAAYYPRHHTHATR